MTAFALHAGRLVRNGEPFALVGVNYHPSRAGCDIWRSWDRGEIDEDLAAMAAAGITTVRFFLFWRDLQTGPKELHQERLRRVATFLELCDEHGLACIPSLFTIWMNGQRLDLPWRAGRSIWRDPDMLDAAARYARAVGWVIAGSASVLAVDLGDEIANVDPVEAQQLTRRDIASWYDHVLGALREQNPGLLALQANDASGVLGASPFGPDAAAGLDLVGVHGFPLWAPLAIESTRAPKATGLVPFLVRYGRAFGPVIVDELGSYGVDAETAEGYLRLAGAAALAHGALGVVVWCWRDITATAEPYAERPGERAMGLVDAAGAPKPILAELRRLATSWPDLAAFEPDAPPIAVYVSERSRHGAGSYLDPGVATPGLYYACQLLQRAHLPATLVTGDLAGYDLVICPSVRHLTLADVDRLRAAAERGAVVYLSVGDYPHGLPDEALGGVEVVDYSLSTAGREGFTWDGQRWPLAWPATTSRTFEVRPTEAETLAAYDDGTAAVTAVRRGAGQLVLCTAPIEQLLDVPGALDGRPWEQLYAGLAARAGIEPPLLVDDPLVEVLTGRLRGQRRALLLNHGPEATTLQVGAPDRSEPVRLRGKDWCWLDLPGRA